MTEMKWRGAMKPFDHQRKEVTEHGADAGRALFWEMGTGKTCPVIAEAVALHEAGEIENLLVIAPNGVHRNWVTDEIPIHMPEEAQAKAKILGWTGSYQSKWFGAAMNDLIKHKDGLRVLCMSYPGIMTKVGGRFARRFLDRGRTLYAADESQFFKTPNAARTKRVVASGKYAPFRRILSGTPITNSPFDIFTQLKFLDPSIWDDIGCGTFAAFKTYFGIWEVRQTRDKTRSWPALVSYRNLRQLKRIVAEHGSRLVKDDVLDLPPKLYSKRYFTLDPAVRRVYDEVKEDYIAFLDDGELVTAPLAIVRMIRMQQVTSGYVPSDRDGPGDVTRLSPTSGSRRVATLMDTLEEHRGRHSIVWAKYLQDIADIQKELKKAGITFVTYVGATSERERDEAKRRFQAGEVEVFLANEAASTGITLHKATLEVFFNTTYRWDARKQAEDRAHRIGQEHPVLIVDIVAEDTIDEGIADALRRKQRTSDFILGDDPREWI